MLKEKKIMLLIITSLRPTTYRDPIPQKTAKWEPAKIKPRLVA